MALRSLIANTCRHANNYYKVGIPIFNVPGRTNAFTLQSFEQSRSLTPRVLQSIGQQFSTTTQRYSQDEIGKAEAQDSNPDYSTDAISNSLRGDGTAPRFYKKVTIQESAPGAFNLYLDDRLLTTPRKIPLTLPSKALAMAIAAEWEWQLGQDIRPYTMPLLTLATTAIDREETQRQLLIAQLIGYTSVDTTCCREEEGSEVAQRQAERLDPLLRRVEEILDVKFKVKDNLFGVKQKRATKEKLQAYLERLNPFELACLDALAVAGKSTVLAIAAVHGDMHPEEVMMLTRLEEELQIENWGLVEGGHDIDRATARVTVAAPLTFLQLLRVRNF